MTLDLHLRLAGVGMIALALIHFAFVGPLNWKAELARLSLLNRQIFYVHTFFVCVVLVGMGVFSACGTHLLLESTPLARAVLASFALFWALRLGFQWFVYDRSLWRGNRFNTVVHWVFTVVFGYLTAVYAWATWR